MSFVKLTPEALNSIKYFLEVTGLKNPIRIDIQSTGCCDPSLGLYMDQVRPSDLLYESEGLQFVISTDTYHTIGEVTIDWVDEASKKGYVVTSSKPLSEWEGFGVCDIRTSDRK